MVSHLGHEAIVIDGFVGKRAFPRPVSSVEHVRGRGPAAQVPANVALEVQAGPKAGGAPSRMSQRGAREQNGAAGAPGTPDHGPVCSIRGDEPPGATRPPAPCPRPRPLAKPLGRKWRPMPRKAGSGPGTPRPSPGLGATSETVQRAAQRGDSCRPPRGRGAHTQEPDGLCTPRSERGEGRARVWALPVRRSRMPR